MATDAPQPTYDLYLSYDPQDRWAVEWLLPRLEAAGLTICVDTRDFAIGLPKLVNRERAVAASRHTLLILTPRWLDSEWAGFESLLVQTSDAGALRRRLLPLILEPCDLPPRIGMLTPADFTDAARWEAELARLLANLADASPSAPRPALDRPLDTVPDPAPLPSNSRMPFLRNPLFVGREDELRALARALLASDTAIAAIAATGMGGVGKSNLASEFVHRYGQFFPGGVFWLSFADPAGVPAEVAACGGPGAMNLPSFDALVFDDQIARVRQEWQRSLACLLVFDNCEDEALLADWRPTSGGARVLVTSRRTDWDSALGVDVLHLAVLPREQSIALLRRFRPDLADDDPDLAAVAAELGDLPLALHLAGSFLKRYRADVTPAAYLDELRAVSPLDHESLRGLELDYSPTRHVLDVGRTFTLSFDKLRPDNAVDAGALALLARASCFASGAPIPRDLLLATLDLPDPPTRRRASRALTRLVDLGLLDEEQDGALTIHRLVVFVARRRVADADALGAVEREFIKRSFELLSKGLPASFAPIQVHLRQLAEPALARADRRASNLCTVMARYLRLTGDYVEALSYARCALAISEATPDIDEQRIAANLDEVARLLQVQGDYTGSRPL